MNNITYEEAIQLVKEAEEMTREELKALQAERLSKLVAYARKNSKVYNELYKQLPENPKLEQLPSVTKMELTSRIEDWICDPEFKTENLEEYLGNTDNLTKKFMGKYNVLTTSGTTGVPLKKIRDERHINVNAALVHSRFYNGGVFKEVKEVINPKSKFASVLATGGFHSAYISFEKTKKMLEEQGIYNTMLLLSINEPLDYMVEKLNEFQPEVLTGYPSALDVLSYEQKEGRLKIKPKAIACSAEQLTESTWENLKDRFKCPVQNMFCSTEGGEVAMLCQKGHLHLNCDWIILEAIDKDENPVKTGQMSDAVLLTNLANVVQPFIRYKVDDCIILHEEQCECGSNLPYIEVLGRTDDIPNFKGMEGRVRLSPIVFLNIAVETEGIVKYQFVQMSDEQLMIRVIYKEGVSQDAVNVKLQERVRKVLECNNLENVKFEIKNEEPVRSSKGKKMKSFIRC